MDLIRERERESWNEDCSNNKKMISFHIKTDSNTAEFILEKCGNILFNYHENILLGVFVTVVLFPA